VAQHTFRKSIFFFTLLLLSHFLWAGNESLSLRIPSNSGFASAGFYAAIEQGYYKEQALDVVIVESTRSEAIAFEISHGNSEYGVLGSSLMDAWGRGLPLVSLAVLLQQSRSVFVVPSSVTILQELAGKTIGIQDSLPPEVKLALRQRRVDVSVVWTDQPRQDFLAGKIDAFVGELGGDPEQLLNEGIDFNVLNPARLGADFYGLTLVTSKWEVERNSKRAIRFLRATLQGWQYAKDHPDELIRQISLRKGNLKSEQQLRAEAQAILELLEMPNIPLGNQESSAWQTDLDQLANMGIIQKPRSVDSLVYSLERLEQNEQQSLFRQIVIVASVSLILAALFMISAWFLWRRMTRHTRLLKESEARLQSALQSTTDAMWEWSGLPRKLWMSTIGFEMLGLNNQDNLVDWEEFLTCFTPEDQYEIQAEIHRIRKMRGSFVLDVRLSKKNLQWVRFRGFANPNEDHPVVTGILQDIHPLKAAEMALRESEAQFRQYFELGLVGMAKISLDGHFVQVNRTCWEILGSDEEDLKTKTWRDFTHTSDIGLTEDLMASVVRGERQGFTLDTRMLNAQSKVLYMLMAMRAVRNDHDEITHWVILLQDISQRRRGEQEKETLLHQLSLKNRTLEGMLQTIGHDFRNPLVTVMWHASELTRLDSGSEEYLYSLKEVKKGVQRLDRMLQGMLGLSRLGRQIPDMLTVYPVQLLQALREELKESLEKCNATLTVAELPPCLGSETMLYEVWKHLLENAIQYRDPTRPLELGVTGKVVREWASYTLQDNGLGIPSSSLGHIFSPFFRLERDAEIDGDGLGLAYVTRILESHRGHIKVESELGKGSRFSLFIPLA